jgi:putative oxidoreductase
MIPHGYDKLQHFGRYSATFTNPFHLGSPVSLGLCIFAELFCAGLVVLGLFTRFATIPLIINMIVASYVIHGDFFGMGQAAALFLAGYISLLFIGPGKASLDGLMGK